MEADKLVVKLLKTGEMCLFPTTAYHFGASHDDYLGQDNTSPPTTKSMYRRRIFIYLDWPPSVVDEHGYIDRWDSHDWPPPADYMIESL